MLDKVLRYTGWKNYRGKWDPLEIVVDVVMLAVLVMAVCVVILLGYIS